MKASLFAKAAVAAVVFGALAAQPAQAQDKLNIVGSVNIFQVPTGAVGNVVVDFRPPVGGGTGAVFSTESFGIFAALPQFTQGVQADLAFGPINPPPAGTPAPLPVGMTFAGAPLLSIGGYTFTVTNFVPGNIPGTPFNLNQSGNNVAADMSLSGFVTGPGLMMQSAFTGIYTTQFNNTTVGDLIASIERGTVVPSSVSASLVVSAVPEPATVTLMATGLVALVGMGYARRRNNA
jgi:hypothetical protein